MQKNQATLPSVKQQLLMGGGMAIAGWFICASFCLWLTISLEAWPAAYDLALPAILAVLFGNLAVFVFVPMRLKHDLKGLATAVIRICLTEGLLLLGLYYAARHWA